MLMFSDILTLNGNSFQMHGPMDEKLELCTILSLLIEIGNINKLPDLSDQDWLDCCMTSSCKYLGALPCTHLNMRTAILYCIRSSTFNQCSSFRCGVM